MDLTSLREDIKLQLTGNILNLELEDKTIDQIIINSLYELQPYFSDTRLITIPYSSCIDLDKVKDPNTKKKIKVNSVFKIYRTSAAGVGADQDRYYSDPMYMAMWNMLAGGSGNYRLFNDFAQNYGAYNTLLQIRNTLSTDLSFRFDRNSNKLYVNVATGIPKDITVEYIPQLEDVKDIKSDYWMNILRKLSLANTKVIIGRVRSKYSAQNSLWELDGETMLSEGIEELKEVRQQLQDNDMYLYPVD